MKNELLALINKQVETDFGESISMNELHEKLEIFINDLIENDFQKLVNILYKVDVDENKLKLALQQDADKNAADTIAKLIIEREKQKIQSRKKFKEKDDWD